MARQLNECPAELEQCAIPSNNGPYPTPKPSPSTKQNNINSPSHANTPETRKRRRSSPSGQELGPEHTEKPQPARRSKRLRTDIRPAAIPDNTSTHLVPPSRSRAPKSSKPLTKRKPKPKQCVSNGSPSQTSRDRRRATSNPLPNTAPPCSASTEPHWYFQSLDERAFLATPPPLGTPLDPAVELDIHVSNIAPLPPTPPLLPAALQALSNPLSEPAVAEPRALDVAITEREVTQHVQFPASSPVLETHVLPSQNLDWIKLGDFLGTAETVPKTEPLDSAAEGFYLEP